MEKRNINITTIVLFMLMVFLVSVVYTVAILELGEITGGIVGFISTCFICNLITSIIEEKNK